MDFLAGLLAKFLAGKAIKHIADEIENRNQPIDMPKNIEEYGFSQSLKNRGSALAYKMNIYHLFETFKTQVSRDENRQEELRRPLKVRREELVTTIAYMQEKIRHLNDTVKEEIKNKIQLLKDEIASVKNNPENLTQNPVNKFLYRITLFALVFLSLFLFYTSTAYSAFFREFTPSQLGVVHAIFSPDAIYRAYQEGIMALLFILCTPFVFFTLGLSIHLFIENRYRRWIAPVLIFAFLFDFLLAYEISEKIYNIKALQSFHDVPLYSLKLAAESVAFWIIIASGFCVYILWGILFHFFSIYNRRQDILTEAIKSRLEKIGEFEKELQELNETIHHQNEMVFEHQKEIVRIDQELNTELIETKLFEKLIYGFTAGWIECLHANKFNPELENQIQKELEKFMKEVIQH